MATITIQQARTVDIDANNIILKRTVDDPIRFRITALIEGLNREIIVWDGADAYAAAGTWTNETVIAQIIILINTDNILFA